MSKISQYLKKIAHFFEFNNKEKNGIIVLLILIGVLLCIKISLYFYKPDFITKYDKQFDEQIAKYEKKLDKKNYKSHKKATKFTYKKKKIDCFDFNPNTLSKNGWQKLGFSEKQANIILKYRNAGGKFYIKKDLLKLYCIDSAKYIELEKYIQLPDSQNYIRSRNELIKKPKDLINKNVTQKNNKIEIIKLNSCNPKELMQIKGIGNTYASRIIKYRDMLGGYFSTSQLAEVYGLPEETIESAKKYLQIETNLIQKIFINTASWKILTTHPYINSDMANAIINSRKQNGYFTDFDNFKTVLNLSKTQQKKLKPYLTFELPKK